MTSLVIVDFNTLFYNCSNRWSQEHKKWVANGEQGILYDLTQMGYTDLYLVLTGALFDNIPDLQEFRVCFVNDVKPYWRQPLLLEKGCNYKGKRKEYGYVYEKHVPTLKKDALSLLRSKGIEVFEMMSRHQINDSTVGFEADDLAAGIIQRYRNDFTHIYLLTVDTDWLPLTTFPNVTWLNLTCQIPRIRNKNVALEWCKSKKDYTDTIMKRKFEWNDIVDLWDFKGQFGDPSDNIKGSIKSQVSRDTFKPFINLLEPHYKFRCWEEPDFESNWLQSLCKPKTKISYEDFLKRTKGQIGSIIPFGLEYDPKGFDGLKIAA